MMYVPGIPWSEPVLIPTPILAQPSVTIVLEMEGRGGQKQVDMSPETSAITHEPLVHSPQVLCFDPLQIYQSCSLVTQFS